MPDEKSQEFNSIPEDRLPPQNIEAEESVLGSLMLTKDAMDKVADILHPADFYRGSHAKIYQAMLDLYEKREPIDILSLSSRLKEKEELEEVGGHSYLANLVNTVPTASNVIHYAKIVRRKKVLRDLIEASYKITLLGYEEREDVDSLLDEAEQRIFEVSQTSVQQEFLPVKAALDEAWQRIEKLHKGDGSLRGLATGFHDLDGYLAGLQKSDLVILAARPSLGKTSLALDIARHVGAKEKIPVGIFSLEMSKEQLVDRLLCASAEVDLWKLRTGRLSLEGEDNDFVRIQQAMDELSKAPIYIDDTAAATVLQMRTMARRLQAEHQLGLVIVDYLQLMQGHTRSDNRVEIVSEISRSLKGLARELNIPVLAISQLSRATEARPDQIPRLSDLRESGCLSGDTLIQNADTGEMIPIKKLVDSPALPISVFGLTDDLKIKKVKMSRVFLSGKKLVYELKMRSGRIIKASGNHPFLKLEGWVRVDVLKTKDKIALPRVLPEIKRSIKIEKERIALLAHLIGDGCYLKKQPLHYTNSDLECIRMVAKSAKKIFGINAKIIPQENWFHVYLSGRDAIKRAENPINRWLRGLGIFDQRSRTKIIPDFIFRLNNFQLAYFVKHLWATDGNISHLSSGNNGYSIYYASGSRKLIIQLQHLLLRLGIISVIRRSEKRGYELIYQLHIQGKTEQLKFLGIVGVFGSKRHVAEGASRELAMIRANPNCDVIPREVWSKIASIKGKYNLSWRAFSSNLGMSYCGSTLFKHGVSRGRMERIVSFMPDNCLIDLCQSDVYWDEVISVTPLGVEEVYDASVPGVHNFIANDIIVHNSIEQDADVVMFIYREDKVRPDSERKNVAEIHIAKHRNGPIGKIELYFNENQVSFKNLERHYTE